MSVKKISRSQGLVGSSPTGGTIINWSSKILTTSNFAVGFPNNSLKPGQANMVRIVNHHSSYLNNKTGYIIGKDAFYGRKVWLHKEQFTVIINQFNLVPCEKDALTYTDVLKIHCNILYYNFILKLNYWLRK